MIPISNRKKPTQTTEEVLAMAITGWLQGNQAAEPDAKMALKLAQFRELALEYLKTEDTTDRKKLLTSLTRSDNELPADVVVRLVE